MEFIRVIKNSDDLEESEAWSKAVVNKHENN